MKSMFQKLLTVATLSLAALSSSPALAVPILTFTPQSQTVNLGEAANLDVMVTGLTGEFVGAYDFNVTWDSSLLALNSLTFGDALDGPLDSLSGVVNGSGTVNAFEVSLGSLANQNGLFDFRLFTLSFDTLAIGTSVLNFVGGIAPTGFLSDELGGLLSTELTAGSITIAQPSTSVPEPGTLGLLGLGMVLAGALKRRRAAPAGS